MRYQEVTSFEVILSDNFNKTLFNFEEGFCMALYQNRTVWVSFRLTAQPPA